MEERGGRRAWLAGLLAATAWALLNATWILPLLERISWRRYRGLPGPFTLPSQTVPVLLWLVLGCLVLAAVFAVRSPTRPSGNLVWWHTRYHLVLGISCLFLSSLSLMNRSPGEPGILPEEIWMIRDVHGRLFLSTAALCLAAWLARRTRSRFAAPATAAANIVLGVFIPAGTLTFFFWYYNVRPLEEPAAEG